MDTKNNLQPGSTIDSQKSSVMAQINIPLLSESEATTFIRNLHAEGRAFHFDDDPGDVFPDLPLNIVVSLRNRITEVFKLLPDPFAFLVELENKSEIE